MSRPFRSPLSRTIRATLQSRYLESCRERFFEVAPAFADAPRDCRAPPALRDQAGLLDKRPCAACGRFSPQAALGQTEAGNLLGAGTRRRQPAHQPVLERVRRAGVILE